MAELFFCVALQDMRSPTRLISRGFQVLETLKRTRMENSSSLRVVTALEDL